MSKLTMKQAKQLIRAYQKLHDGLSDMIEEGRLREEDIPDDYQWLVAMLERIGNMPGQSLEGIYI